MDDQGGMINPDPSKTDSGVAVALRFHLFSLKMEKTQSDIPVLQCQGKTVVYLISMTALRMCLFVISQDFKVFQFERT